MLRKIIIKIKEKCNPVISTITVSNMFLTILDRRDVSPPADEEGPGIQARYSPIQIIDDGPNHPLKSLEPDTWNNIPLCLVKALKLLIDTGLQHENKIKYLTNQFES